MKTREKINLNENMLGVVVKMAEGNPGAAVALAALLKDDPMAFINILNLDDMGMRGSQIHVAFKDYCKGDVAKFKQAIMDRDPAMVRVVNECGGHAAGTPPAVTGGASFA